MNTKDYIKEVYTYTNWANQQYFAVAEGLTEEQLRKMHGHSWGDVHGMLPHILSSESAWLQRWHGTSPKGHLDSHDFPTLAAMFAWMGVSHPEYEAIQVFLNLSGQKKF